MTGIKVHVCEKCGHRWNSLVLNPLCCPLCGSYYPQKYKEVEE